ncbi:MAG: hypothetical protein ACE5NN_03380 [Candidatus Bathyarchaeia archaeon]
MRNIWLRIVGTLMIAVMAYLFLSVAIQRAIVPFEYATYPVDDSLVSTDGEVGSEVSYALWEQRHMDTTVLAFLLFVTAACCASILGEER